LSPALKCEIVVATKDRLDDLIHFISSLSSQTVLPTNLIIVDAGTDKKSISETLKNAMKGSKINLVYLESQPGLTRQRNIGIARVSKDTDVVFFFDDDIVLSDSTYVQKILDRYSEDASHQFGCIFGKDVSEIGKREKLVKKTLFERAWQKVAGSVLGVISRLFLVSSSRVYGVLSSGMNTSNGHRTASECNADWQPGCCMSFRKEVLDRFTFDETLVGYCMREDLDISFRIAREFRILYLPSASLLHKQSPQQRAHAARFGEMDIKSWHWFVSKNMPRFKNRVCFWWALPGYLLMLLLSALLYRRSDDYFRWSGGIKACSDILMSREAGTEP
jgi:GT2 family glycosyltransferase